VIHNGILFSHKKKELLQYLTTWMEFESIILSKISQRKTICSHLCVESKIKKPNKLTETIDWYLPEVEGGQWGEMGEGGQKVQISSYKIN